MGEIGVAFFPFLHGHKTWLRQDMETAITESLGGGGMFRGPGNQSKHVH